MLKSVMIFTAIAGLISASQAHAQAEQNQDYAVSYKMSELATPSGADSVLTRIDVTAEHTCRDDFVNKRISHRLDYERCLRRVKNDLIAKIAHPNLEQAALNRRTKLAQTNKTNQTASLK